MLAHHGAERGQVGRPTGGGVEDRSDLAEEVRADAAGGGDRERPGVEVAAVVEAGGRRREG